jgi:hypothetical protein
MAKTANPRYEKALAFAVRAHGSVHQARKGTAFPYVSRPIRVAEILDRFGCGEDVVVAGFLHDTVEDASIDVTELENQFGARVAQLVTAASEPDKSLPWHERKELTLAALGREHDADIRALVAADKLDNVRSLADTRRHIGAKEMWSLFNAPESDQRWYYRRIAEILLAHDPNDRLFRTLDYETQALFPDTGHSTRFFAGKPLRTPHDARAYLADPIKHWKPDHSGLELATSWIGAGRIPDSVRAVFDTSEVYEGCELVEGFFEREVELGTAGRASQTDLLAVLRLRYGLVVAAVEGKAREPFGDTVAKWNTTPGTQTRLDDLCRRLGIDVSQVSELRYQLLHRTASALIEAERYGAGEALMLVHSFDRSDASLHDYQSFARALGVEGADVNTITTPVERGGVTLRLGWVKDR